MTSEPVVMAMLWSDSGVVEVMVMVMAMSTLTMILRCPVALWLSGVLMFN